VVDGCASFIDGGGDAGLTGGDIVTFTGCTIGCNQAIRTITQNYCC